MRVYQQGSAEDGVEGRVERPGGEGGDGERHEASGDGPIECPVVVAVGWGGGRHGCRVVDGALDHLWRKAVSNDGQGAGRRQDVRGPGGNKFLLLVAWKALTWAMVVGAEDGLASWVRATEESSVGAVRVDTKAADCRSRDERAADAMAVVEGW